MYSKQKSRISKYERGIIIIVFLLQYYCYKNSICNTKQVMRKRGRVFSILALTSLSLFIWYVSTTCIYGNITSSLL